MRNLIVGLLLALALVPLAASANLLCFFKYQRVSGLRKICVYSCIAGDTAITISAIDLCPLSIDDED